MTHIIATPSLRRAALAIALIMMAGGALADKPDWAGGKHKEDQERHAGQGQGEQARRDYRDDRRGGPATLAFGEAERRAISDYYASPKRKGKCPPGLAKKHNGCLPPGQAKRWQRGQPLAKEVRVYELPQELRVRLPPPPPEHRYVRVAGDILMVAIGTGLVVDAVEDILR